MRTSDHRVDNFVRSGLKSTEMTEEEANATWASIEAQLVNDVGVVSSTNRKGARKKFAVALTIGLAALIFASIALLPVWSGSENGGSSVGSLESATASEVLAITGEETSSISLFPGEGEELYFQALETAPNDAVEQIEEWIGPDGVGHRRDPTRGSSSEGSADNSTDTKPLTETFNANDGPDPRFGVSESWRAVLSMGQLENLSVKPREALKQLRFSVSQAVGHAPDFSRDVQGIVGQDLVVLMTVTNLLTQAPMTGEQREAMFRLIETSPAWMKSNGTASARTTNRGESVSRAGQTGILIETAIDLSRTTSAILGVNPGTWRLGVLLDPTAGSVLEVRRTQAGDTAPYSLTTTEKLEVVGS